MARLPKRRARRQCTPHLESNARNCDMRTTYRMSHGHGTYVPPGVVLAASNAYVRINNNKKKMGSAHGVVEPKEGR